MSDSLAIAKASLDAGGAQDIVSIAIKGQSSLADHMLIASGTSSRHVAALAERLMAQLKRQAKLSSKIEGLPDANWVLVDAGDIIIHIFRPEVRAYYQIEDLWRARQKRD